MSKEPSMEDILSSIKRIIAEEGDEAAQAAAPRSMRRGRGGAVAEPDEESGGVIRSAQVDEVLELTDAFDLPGASAGEVETDSVQSTSPEFQEMPQPARSPAPEPALPTAAASSDTMLSVESEVAARHSLSTLSSMLVKPQGSEDNTLEALVRELLRPMMKQWLDANLPDLVEAMVAKEIARITSREL